ncbi:MAG: hypothetical protein SF123_03875 [Chloroflexota bacterium]|nr:hypothetical protein [Chloroflexota bacterium]
MDRLLLSQQRSIDYAQLSMYEKRLLMDWVRAHVTRELVWEYTSVGIQSLFEESDFGFPITHAQMQQALMEAGCYPENIEAETWVVY